MHAAHQRDNRHNPLAQAGTTPDGDKMGYVMNTESGWVTSEAMSYGMMIAVQFNQKDVFDSLWTWAWHNMRHVTGKYKGE
jgi:oligosaccharide reducing-end xylanase